MYIEIPDNSNKIPYLRKEDKLSVIDWLIDNTILTKEQISELCDIDDITVNRMFNAELKSPFVPKDPIRNEYIKEELLSFIQKETDFPIPSNKECPDKPLEYAPYEKFLREHFFSVKLIKTYFLSQGHNAWWGTWSSKYIKERSIHLTLNGAKKEAEKHRTQGRVFNIKEVPTLCLYAKGTIFFISGINANEENPFKCLLNKELETIEHFIYLLTEETERREYPQFVFNYFDGFLYLNSLDFTEEYSRYVSESVGIDYLLSFSSSKKSVNMEFLKKTYLELTNILKK